MLFILVPGLPVKKKLPPALAGQEREARHARFPGPLTKLAIRRQAG